jgi:phosphoglycolate phosphatase
MAAQSCSSGIIFDLDGTLWDSIDTVVASWNSVLMNEGYDFRVSRKELLPHIGKPMDVVVAHTLYRIPESKRSDVASLCCEYECEYLSLHGGILYPRLIETLETLARRYFLSIVSNCQLGYIEAFVSAHSLGNFFLDTECWGRTGLNKEDNIGLIVERNKLEKAVYVGDTDGDRIAAERSGVEFIYATYGFGEVDGADYSIADLSELPRVIDTILSSGCQANPSGSCVD